ncbi:MAG: hypothetical protein ACLFTK_18050, partial [Anaerolineales bacterium]
MINEPGTDYQPRPGARSQPDTPTETTPPDFSGEPRDRAAEEAPPSGMLYRPFWLRFTGYFLLFIAINRLCVITAENALTAIVQLANVGLLFVIVVGLFGARRWAGRLLVIYCAWSVISAIVVGVVRMTWVEQAVDDPADYDIVRLLQVRDMVLSFIFYTALGVWTFINLRRFTPSGENRYGNLPYVIIVGLLALFT